MDGGAGGTGMAMAAGGITVGLGGANAAAGADAGGATPPQVANTPTNNTFNQFLHGGGRAIANVMQNLLAACRAESRGAGPQWVNSKPLRQTNAIALLRVPGIGS